MRKSMHVIQDYDTPVSNYVRMWLKKISHRKFAKRTHTTMGMVQALYMCHIKSPSKRWPSLSIIWIVILT